jgi:hypothetical protein
MHAGIPGDPPSLAESGALEAHSSRCHPASNRRRALPGSLSVVGVVRVELTNTRPPAVPPTPGVGPDPLLRQLGQEGQPLSRSALAVDAGTGQWQ